MLLQKRGSWPHSSLRTEKFSCLELYGFTALWGLIGGHFSESRGNDKRYCKHCCVIVCYAMLCYDMLCYTMLCYAICHVICNAICYSIFYAIVQCYMLCYISYAIIAWGSWRTRHGQGFGVINRRRTLGELLLRAWHSATSVNHCATDSRMDAKG